MLKIKINILFVKNKKPCIFKVFIVGEPSEGRTPDTMIKSRIE